MIKSILSAISFVTLMAAMIFTVIMQSKLRTSRKELIKAMEEKHRVEMLVRQMKE